MSAVAFDPVAHRYTLDGRVLPGVTSILAPLQDFSMVNPDVLKNGQAMGTAVHRATELYDLGELDMASLSPALVPYLDAWVNFRHECSFIPCSIEERLVHPVHGYAGTCDRTGMVDGDMAVLDIKKMVTLGPVIGVQLAAYQAMLNLDSRQKPVTVRYALGLRADGTYRLQKYDSPNDYAVFLSLLTIHNWKVKNGH